MYTWQRPEWPTYSYNRDELNSEIQQYLKQLGELSGIYGCMSADDSASVLVESMVSNAMDTSKIEGENLDRHSVRSSIKQFLQLAPPTTGRASQKESGVAAMMVENRKTVCEPLSASYLHKLHELILNHERDNVLVKINLGQYRTSPEPMQIVSGAIGYETVHYEAPPSSQVPQEMEVFIRWFNDTAPKAGQGANLSGVERAAIAHLWFETIHPYDDGNGRVGRAIADKALSQDAGQAVLFNVASVMLKNRNEYYERLNDASLTLDVQEWVSWFVNVTLKAQSIAKEGIDRVLEKTRYWDKYSQLPINDRQQKAINKMFALNPQDFGMTTKKYVSITQCSKATASRDLAQLHEWGCFEVDGQGRGTRYNLNIPAPR